MTIASMLCIRLRRAHSLLGACMLMLAAAGIPDRALALELVAEFYNARYDHYFRTSDQDEIALLESEPARGWIRTGMDFVAGAAPYEYMVRNVCRFFAAAHTSHFYTAHPDECARVQALWPHVWAFEGNAFQINVPIEGRCGGSRTPVYRLYNNRPDVNHRYVTDLNVYESMPGHGWILEGMVMCAYPSDRRQLFLFHQVGLLAGQWQSERASLSFTHVEPLMKFFAEETYAIHGEYRTDSGRTVHIEATLAEDGSYRSRTGDCRSNFFFGRYCEEHEFDLAFDGDVDHLVGRYAFRIIRNSAVTEEGSDDFRVTRVGRVPTR